MNNNFRNNDVKLSVSFFRKGKSYYYELNEEIYEINNITINKLKEKLNVPFKVKFYTMSRAQIEKIIAYLLDSTMDVLIKQIAKEKDDMLIIEATFVEKKRYIETYKVPNISSLYSRTTSCNPFLYINKNSKKILIEVSKNFAKNNPGDYYFLYYDLDRSERDFFDSQYTKLECDYVYRMEKDLSHKKTKQKIKKNKLKNKIHE